MVIGSWDKTEENVDGHYATSDGWGSKDLHYNLNGEKNEDGTMKLEPVYPCYYNKEGQGEKGPGKNPFTCIVEDVKMVRYYTMGH